MSRTLLIAAALAALSFSTAHAQDAGPGDVPDGWNLQTQGKVICQIKLTGHAGAVGYDLSIPHDCGVALPATAAAWKPTDKGLALVAPDGQVLMGFTRWSQSLFVASSGGPDLQLARASLGR